MCLSMGWLQSLLINLVILVAIIAIIRLFVPLLAGLIDSLAAGWGSVIAQIINIVLWAIVVIFIIYLVFGLISCLLGGAGFSGFSLLPHR